MSADTDKRSHYRKYDGRPHSDAGIGVCEGVGRGVGREREDVWEDTEPEQAGPRQEFNILSRG
jgi:hypothetical protein